MDNSKDWKAWHSLYDNSESGLAKRLGLVQRAIYDSLPSVVETKFQIIDICSGDGRDLLDVLERYPSRDRVHSYLVELDVRLAREAERAASLGHLKNVTVVNGDASLLGIYSDELPADLILLCGVFGNIGDDDIQNTIKSMPQLCKPGTKIIWTRHLRQPEIVPAIQELFTANYFREVDLKKTDDMAYAVATYEYYGPPVRCDTNTRLFTFVK